MDQGRSTRCSRSPCRDTVAGQQDQTSRREQNIQPGDLVRLNVGGTLFLTSKTTLQTLPDTWLAGLTKESPCFNSELNSFYFDRDPGLFSHVLNVYRWGELHVPTHVCPLGFQKELEFWGIPSGLILPCCWKAFYSGHGELAVMEKLQEATSSMVQSASVHDSSHPVKVQSWRERLWKFLDDPYSSLAAKIWFYIYISVVLLSALVYLCWMIPSLRVSPYLHYEEAKRNHSNSKIDTMAMTDPHLALFLLDTLCMVVFTVELLLRFAVCPNKVAFCKSWLNVLNALLVAVMIVTMAIELRKDWIESTDVGILFYVLKNLNVFRLLMLVRLQQNYVGLKVLLLSVRNSGRELFLMTISFLVAVLIYAGLVFCAEIHTDSFPDIWTALWWAIVTMTTVGYGEVVPRDTVGRIVGSFCAINGVLILALPIAVIATNFTEYYTRKDYHAIHEMGKKRETTYDRRCSVQAPSPSVKY